MGRCKFNKDAKTSFDTRQKNRINGAIQYSEAVMLRHAVQFAKDKNLDTVYLFMVEMCVVDSRMCKDLEYQIALTYNKISPYSSILRASNKQVGKKNGDTML